VKTATFPEESEFLKVEVRKKMYQLIKASEGIHVKEMCRRLQLAEGTATHHLNYLRRKGLLKASKDGKKLRYFTNAINVDNRKLLALLREQAIRRILMFLSVRKKAHQKNLARFAKISPGTATFHLKKLEKKGIIVAKTKGRMKEYRLTVDAKQIAYLLYNYKESFADTLLDRIIEMWDF